MEVRRYAGLEALPEGYQSLLEAAEKESFFSGALWYRALLATTRAPGDEICLYGVEDEGNGLPLALLPAWSSPREPGPVGARLLSGAHSVYTMAYAPIICAAVTDRRAVIQALVRAFSDDRPRWDVVSLRLLDQGAEDFDLLLEALSGCGWSAEPYFQFGNLYEETAGGSFEDYVAGRGKSVRKTIARAVRHFDDREDGRYELFAGEGSPEAAFEAFNQVYGASWKEDEIHPAFVERLMRDCAERGVLRLANLYIEERPVATWFVIAAAGTAYLWKTAYDESLPSKLSVGGVLTYKVMRHLIDVDRVACVDFGIGDETYKTKWMSKRRERWGIMAYNRGTPRGALLAAMKQGRSLARRFLRKETAE